MTRFIHFSVSLIFFVGSLVGFSSANFRYGDFNETTGLKFIQDAATTSCRDDPDLSYGDTHGNADSTVSLSGDGAQQGVELGETTDSVRVYSGDASADIQSGN